MGINDEYSRDAYIYDLAYDSDDSSETPDPLHPEDWQDWYSEDLLDAWEKIREYTSSSYIRFNATYAEFVELVLTVYAGEFIVGSTYTIFVVGTTDFTAIGASSNTVGVAFIATGVGTGTGKAQQIYTFCNAAAPVVVNGITYAGYGTFLGISEIQQDMKASSVDIKVSLTGLDINVVSLILASPVKGSTVKIWRGFLDTSNQIQTIGGVQQFFQRYQGIVNNVAINENFDTSFE
jgi:hypothetical protein